jgi:hypothetical protein
MRSRISSCLVGALLLVAVGSLSPTPGKSVIREAEAFELKMPLISCEGHEFLAVQAALNAGIPPAYHDSFMYGIRYVDLGTRTIASAVGDKLSWIPAGLNIPTPSGLIKLIHENEPTQHHHFCLRGNAADFPSLVRDTAAWIQKLYNDAQAIPIATTQQIVDGGLVVQGNRKTVNTRFFLLGAALHAIQDSFAHGSRTPVYGAVQATLADGILTEWGGPEGKNFTGLYTELREAVLYPTALPGTATHNAVYGKPQGSPYESDKVWNATVCDTVRSHLGNLQPHAFAAYLASLDFLRAFQSNAGLTAFFNKWFGIGKPVAAADIKTLMFRTRANVAPQSVFPGLGNPMGKCSTANFASNGMASCLYLSLPGESAYPANAWGLAAKKKFAARGEACNADLPCVQLPGATLACIKDGPEFSTAPSTCQTPIQKGAQKPKLGEACALDVGCSEGVCAQQALTIRCRAKAGGVCASDSDCAGAHCKKASSFTPTGTCE